LQVSLKGFVQLCPVFQTARPTNLKDSKTGKVAKKEYLRRFVLWKKWKTYFSLMAQCGNPKRNKMSRKN
jgi:hypothetical protein